MSAAPAIAPAALRPRQVASYLSVSVETLARWREQGYGPPYVKAGNHRQATILYRLVDLDAWLSDHLVDGGVK
jgi:hypothetical protein